MLKWSALSWCWRRCASRRWTAKHGTTRTILISVGNGAQLVARDDLI
jgi:hypothetical protein